MFTGKAANVIKKLNTMDKKTAYTWGGVVLVIFITLMTMASFLGNPASDSSFDDLQTRGYDLAQMPFVSDEAEQYLLSSKYPDMQRSGVTALYSPEEKAARQEADAEAAEEQAQEAGLDTSVTSAAKEVWQGRVASGYSGSSGGAGRTPTSVGQLGSASMGKSSGSGISATYGAPRGDFTNFKRQDKGSEQPFIPPASANAQRALNRFTQGSRAAAGQKNDKASNARKALIGGNIKGSDSFMADSSGVKMGDSKGLNLDENAPVSTDMSGIDDALQDANDRAERDNEEKQTPEKSFWGQLFDKVVDMGLEMGKRAIGNAIDNAMDAKAYKRDIAKNASLVTGKKMSYKEAVAEYPNFTPEQQSFISGNAASGATGRSNERVATQQADAERARRDAVEAEQKAAAERAERDRKAAEKRANEERDRKAREAEQNKK